MSRSPLVVNASPVILLSRIDALDLLPSLTSQVILPEAVLQEVRAGASRQPRCFYPEQIVGIEVRPDISVPVEVSAWDLGAGESQVLAHALGLRDCEAVLDDRQARRCAQSLGIRATGTLGILLRARRSGLIPAARPMVEALLREGMYLSPELVQAALREVGE